MPHSACRRAANWEAYPRDDIFGSGSRPASVQRPHLASPDTPPTTTITISCADMKRLRSTGTMKSWFHPRWTPIKLTRQMADANSHLKRQKGFKIDQTLKQKGYRVTKHDDYKNPTRVRRWDRGHMVQFDDARGYAEQAGKDSFYTSNICPQLSLLNQNKDDGRFHRAAQTLGTVCRKPRIPG